MRSTAADSRRIFDRQEEATRHINPSLLRRGCFLREPRRLLDRRGELNMRAGIGLPGSGGDIFGIRALVMRCRADDRIERRRQAAYDLVGLLVAGGAGRPTRS